ncbi:MAG TPA: glucose-1-phosphate thymidylyltransferase RfbA [Micropepsaceae bacterium]|nr:glucose-1-phosphate thymidylyltransferase RfbA [Micropepsaceae bacterium]
MANPARKAIVLAGGSGSRLFPATRSVSKQLLPVYDKPLIYYPLSTLMLIGIREIVIVSQPDVLPRLQDLLGDGRQIGIEIEYVAQPRPDGIAQALIVTEKQTQGRNICLILGDNFLYGTGLPAQLREAGTQQLGATIFAYPVARPEMYAVVALDSDGRILSLEEKPKIAKSNLAVPGLYFYDENAARFARTLTPSPRGELEITDLNRIYLDRGELSVSIIGRGTAWLDGGTPETLFEAGQFVRVIEQRTSLKIACIEEVAYRAGFISIGQLANLAEVMRPCSYRDYLNQIVTQESAETRPPS